MIFGEYFKFVSKIERVDTMLAHHGPHIEFRQVIWFDTVKESHILLRLHFNDTLSSLPGEVIAFNQQVIKINWTIEIENEGVEWF